MADEPELLLDLTPDGSSGEDPSRGGTDKPPTSGPRWLLFGGLVLAAVLAAVLFLWPQSTEDSDDEAPADAELAVDDETDDDASEVVEEPSESTVGGDAASDEAESVRDLPVLDFERVVVGTETRSEGPLLGEKTGLGLVLGGSSQSPGTAVQIFVLDTGEIITLDDVAGQPRGLADGRLVVDAGERRMTVDLRQPSLAVEPLTLDVFEQQDRFWTDLIAVHSNLIWGSRIGEGGSSLVAISVDGGEPVVDGDASYPDTYFGGTWPDLWANQRVVQGRDRGIYRESGGGFERLGFGWVVASIEDAVLVTECNTSMECVSLWRDRTSWDLLPYSPTPLGQGDTVLWSHGSTIHVLRSRQQVVEVVDVVSGEVRFRYPTSILDDSYGDLGFDAFSNGGRVTGTTDGRWIAVGEDDGYLVVDLTSGTQFLIDDSEWETRLRRPIIQSSKVLIDLTGTALAP